jgi:hypothetical protein
MVKKPLLWESQTTVLRPGEKLTRLSPDWKARRTRDGDRRVFICEDKYGHKVLLAQKVTLLAEHLSKIARDKSEAISTTSLYNILGNDGTGLNCGYSKHRWKVRAYPIDKAVDAFESAREAHDTAVVLGSKACMQTQLRS